MTQAVTEKGADRPGLILASASPRRKQLLSALGLHFDVFPSDYDESNHPYSGDPVSYCEELAVLKGKAVSLNFPDSIVISADTIVVLNGAVMGKPADRAEAVEMLKRLSGQTHEVYTGVSIQYQKADIEILFHERTDVTFGRLIQEEIAYYVENFAPYDKAGSYGIQDWSVTFVNKIDGCYNNVVGFPVFRFYKAVKDLELPLEFHHN